MEEIGRSEDEEIDAIVPERNRRLGWNNVGASSPPPRHCCGGAFAPEMDGCGLGLRSFHLWRDVKPGCTRVARNGLSDADIFAPQCGIFTDEGAHQLDTFVILNNLDTNTAAS